MKKVIWFLILVIAFGWTFKKGIQLGSIATIEKVQTVNVNDLIVDRTNILSDAIKYVASTKNIDGTIFECLSIDEIETRVMKYVMEMAEAESTAIWMDQ